MDISRDNRSSTSNVNYYFDRIAERKKRLKNQTKPIRTMIRKFNTFFSRHYVLIFIILLIVCCIINCYIFSCMDPNDPNNWDFTRSVKELDNKKYDFISNPIVDGLYFTFTTFSTIGYGDVVPKSSRAKIWCGFIHGSVILLTYKLFEYYMNVDNESNESALFTAYEQMRSEKENLEDEIAECRAALVSKRESKKIF